MLKPRKLLVLIAAASLVAMVNLGGCTKKPSAEEVTKLEQARTAAESAEKKLAELRAERQKLEQQLEAKKGELKANEGEQNAVQQNMGK